MSVTSNHNKSPLSLATSVCSNITSVSLLRLSFRISPAAAVLEGALNACRRCWYNQVRFLYLVQAR